MKKIIFNDKYGLTEAVLSGRKTQTRRIIPKNFFTGHWDEDGEGLFYEDCNGYWHPATDSAYAFQKGEIVAIAQNYDVISEEISKEPSHEKALFYCKVMKEHYPKETEPRDKEEIPGWYNKMFVRADLMPHQIRITNVRVERLQDISNEDCLKEGVEVSATDNIVGYPFGVPFNYFIGEDKPECRYSTPRHAYACLIDKISGKGTFESNPYVFVYDFELVR